MGDALYRGWHVDGQQHPRSRPPTNPYRHAYVRAKHFRRALDRIQLFAGSYGHCASAAVIFFPALVRVQAAAENADWGCR